MGEFFFLFDDARPASWVAANVSERHGAERGPPCPQISLQDHLLYIFPRLKQ